MSGFCGLVSLDGPAPDRGLLERLTATLRFRGPDAQAVWTDARAGLGHALARTGPAGRGEAQPCSLDGRLWIVADARVDARAELIAALDPQHRAGLAEAGDAELILHAYRAWGERCLEYLLGDFAFALWDAPNRRLFCARDPFGVKQFYYAWRGGSLVFSNTLACVRAHPDVAGTLDDLAIADFLLFEMNQDPAGTAFAAIRRLRPGHSLSCNADGLSVRAWAALPAPAEVHYRAAEDYVARFRELLDRAVADRLPAEGAGVEMSGGLDSTAIAATARRLLGPQGRLAAHTVVFDRLFVDEERHYAGLAARHLGLPIQFFPGDGYGLRAGLEGRCSPEPANDPQMALMFDLCRERAAQERVILTGWDGDALLNESPKPYFRHLWRTGQGGRLLRGLLGYVWLERRLLPHGLADRLRPAPGAEPALPYPAWLNPEFERTNALRERWREVQGAPRVGHPLRPHAHQVFAFMLRDSQFFSGYDAEWTRQPLDYRHPLLDLRLLAFGLALPPHPWCVKKRILRLAMAGQLPEPVLRRPKTPLAGWPHLALLQREVSRDMDRLVAAPGLERYIDPTKVPVLFQEADPERAYLNLRPSGLNIWLQHL